MTADERAPEPVVTFVVRLRLEWSLLAPSWRGRVLHLESGEAASFQEWQDLQAFLQSIARTWGAPFEESSNQRG